MKINFTIVPAQKISGGPLAILEYANRLIDRGHEVSITTLPRAEWGADSPFPWFKFKGKIHYHKLKLSGGNILSGLKNLKSKKQLYSALAGAQMDIIAQHYGTGGITWMLKSMFSSAQNNNALQDLYWNTSCWPYLINAMPDCDINIATIWSTILPVYYSRKGKPAVYMQHSEDMIYPLDSDNLASRLLARLSMSLPVFKIANSSWLRDEVAARYGQKVPFQNNAIEISDFNPAPKLSEQDGIIRLLTYSRPEEWKGFADAAQAVRELKKIYGDKLQWHVFGYRNPVIAPDNEYAPYKYHPNLSFKSLSRLYAQSDVTLCPSWYESFPLPPLESMACGTAVVTTRYGTEDYAFNEETALVVNPRACKDMCAAVRRLIEDKELRARLAAAGRKKAEEFTWERAAASFEKNISDIVSGNVGYDVYAPAKLAITDHSGRNFEEMPEDITVADLSLLESPDGGVYLVKNGSKHRILARELLNSAKLRGKKRETVDPITFFRIPTGTPVSAEHDI